MCFVSIHKGPELLVFEHALSGLTRAEHNIFPYSGCVRSKHVNQTEGSHMQHCTVDHKQAPPGAYHFIAALFTQLQTAAARSHTGDNINFHM